jgi:uncharacterized protein (DUF169 family)
MIIEKDKLKKIFGPRLTAVNINGVSQDFINVPSRAMRLCEAVELSFNFPLRINNENLDCMGARRSTGFDSDDNKLIREISVNSGISESYITMALSSIPSLAGVRHLNLGLTESNERELEPDLYLMYVQPSVITALMYNLAKSGIKPFIPSYSFLAVCGSVLANCYTNRVISISFGCPESRKHGGIRNHEVVLGIPAETIPELLRYYN